MKRGYFGYVKAAFNAKLRGMFLSPNLVALTLGGILGFANPGFWLITAGLELAYLNLMAGNPRFQRWVDYQDRGPQPPPLSPQQRLSQAIATLDAESRERVFILQERCREILRKLSGMESRPGLNTHQQGLGELVWLHVRLLRVRSSIQALLADGAQIRVQRDLRELEQKLAVPTLSAELRTSLEGQKQILLQRQRLQQEGVEKLAYVQSELERIEHQAELIRDQASLSNDPGGLSASIDAVAGTLSTTTDWMREQHRVLSDLDDLAEEPPVLTLES